MFGKRLYKTSMLNFFRLIILAITVFFFNNFYLETFTYENFQSVSRFKFVDVFEYHYRYPFEFITFFILIIGPAVYYSLIRGARFHERGFIINKGLPFWNKSFRYEEVKSYKLLHPELAISIHMNEGEVFVVLDNNVKRVLAILDQHNIQGDLAHEDFVRLITSTKRIVIILVSITVLIFVLKKTGLFHISF
ncbi:MAG: hypothetical protein AB7I27_15900 [Bacteriovoracaceae bacterium]